MGVLPNDLSNDGTFTFGGGFSYTYDPNNRAVAGKFDFIGVAMHEISEIMGRIGLMGENPPAQSCKSPPLPAALLNALRRFAGFLAAP